jgi:NAD(P)-dependent dehydrogenase (short-subunit alcohol dehydrogenase family)
MDLGLKDRVAVVTGGTSGIGLVTARLLLAEGCRVAICGRDTERLQAAQAVLAGGDRLLTASCDVRDQVSVAELASRLSDWGGGRCDLLVNNAGQGRVSTSDDGWRDELELKFFSQIYPIRAFGPLLLKSSHPAIVVVNSLLALQPEAHMVATAAARAGVQNMVKSLAREFAPRIRVNSILLGLVDSGQWQRRYEARSDKAQTRDAWFADLAKTKGIPLGRLGEPDEAARAILFLGSPAASYITGASLEVSGGVSRHI